MRTPFFTLAAAALLQFSCITGEEPAGPDDSLSVGDPMPLFAAVGPSGIVSTADLVGKRALVVLFRTTCPDCRRELPVIEQARERIGEDSGVRFVAISKEDETVVADYWEQTGYGMPWYLDPEGDAFAAFTVDFVPTLYLFGSDGKVAFKTVETFDLTADKLVELIKGLE